MGVLDPRPLWRADQLLAPYVRRGERGRHEFGLLSPSRGRVGTPLAEQCLSTCFSSRCGCWHPESTGSDRDLSVGPINPCIGQELAVRKGMTQRDLDYSAVGNTGSVVQTSR